MVQEIWSTVIAEFSDIPDAATVTKITIRILVAAFLGGILGYERERKARGAGVRTHMLVAIGAAIFMIGPTQAGMSVDDLSRVIQGVIQGIGFLGAGAIIMGTATRKVQGLTTAASIWAAAGIGIAAGLGIEATAVLATVVVMLVLAVVPLFVTRVPQTSSDSSRKTEQQPEDASKKAEQQPEVVLRKAEPQPE